jgi:rhodanese-related sulfurtransferase
MQMVNEAMAEVPSISPEKARQEMQQDPNTLIVDVRDAEETREGGIIPSALNVSLGMLPARADQELPEEYRHPPLQDRSRPIILVCNVGLNAARGGKLLKEMGFTHVRYLEGGMKAWIDSKFPTEKPGTPPPNSTRKPSY